MDWSNFSFVAKKDTWFIAGSNCECESAWDSYNNDMIEDFDGIFNGYTNETYEDYDGELPRYDGEVCSFDEFDIYFKDILVNKLSLREIKILERKIKLEKL